MTRRLVAWLLYVAALLVFAVGWWRVWRAIDDGSIVGAPRAMLAAVAVGLLGVALAWAGELIEDGP